MTKEEKFNKELIHKLEEEIKALEKQISNRNILINKFMKKSLITLNLVSPYIIAPSLIIEFMNICGGGIPFIDDELKYYLLREYEIDTLGNTKISESYERSTDNYDITFTYIDKFKPNEDGTYSRNVTVYDASKIDKDTLIKIINNQDNSNINDLFNKTITNKIETKNNISPEELEEEFYMSYSYYDYDKNEYIYVKNSLKKNIIIGSIDVALSLFICLFIIKNLRTIGEYNYKRKLEEVDKDYYFDSEYVKKLIRIKKDNYNLLVGNNENE